VLRDIAFHGERCALSGDYGNLLSYDIQVKAGLTKRTQQQLASMNDGTEFRKPKTFKEIAQWIRKHL
jgi:hypothetical protein